MTNSTIERMARAMHEAQKSYKPVTSDYLIQKFAQSAYAVAFEWRPISEAPDITMLLVYHAPTGVITVASHPFDSDEGVR